MAMSCVGIDIGNNSSVVAEAASDTVKVVCDAEFNYETPSIISFAGKRRQFGSPAKAFSVSNPIVTISQIKRLVGREFASVNSEDFLFPILPNSDGGILIRAANQDFSPVQILAMLLSHLKKEAEAITNRSIEDCVIAIPSYFGDAERVAYLDASKVARLKPRQLMHEGTAIALGYGYYKDDIKSDSHVAFVDVGHCSTQITIVKFYKGGMRVLSHSYDQNLGGRDFDKLLFTHFSTKLKQKHNIDIDNVGPRACARFQASCEKVKIVLTANTEASLSVEGLRNDVDFSHSIEREEFERLSSNLLERILVVCKRSIKEANLSTSELQVVELVGSGSRIPAISKILSEHFDINLSRTLNSIESVSRGCALQCAMHNKSSWLIPYKVEDSIPFTIGFLLNHIAQTPSDVIQNGQLFPHTTIVEIESKHKTFDVFLCHIDRHNSYQIGRRFKVGPFHATTEGPSIVEIKIFIDINGVIVLNSATLRVINKGYTMSSNKLNLNITEISSFGMKEACLSQAISIEDELANKDRLVEETLKKRNALETHVYDIREKLAGKYGSIANNSKKKNIFTRLNQVEEWLYKDGRDASMDTYSQEIKRLKKLVDTFERQYKNFDADVEVPKDKTIEIINMAKEDHGGIAKLLHHIDYVVTQKRNALNKIVSQLHEELNGRLSNFASKSEHTMIVHELEQIKSNISKATNEELELHFPTLHLKLKQLAHPLETRCHEKGVVDKAIEDLRITIGNCKRNIINSLPSRGQAKVTRECSKVEYWLEEALKSLNSSALYEKPTINFTEIDRRNQKLNRMMVKLRHTSTSSKSSDRAGLSNFMLCKINKNEMRKMELIEQKKLKVRDTGRRNMNFQTGDRHQMKENEKVCLPYCHPNSRSTLKIKSRRWM